MSAPVDDFDLDIRIGETIRIIEQPMARTTSDFEGCQSACATCGSCTGKHCSVWC